MKTTIVVLLLSTLCLTTAAYGDQRAGFMTTSVVLDTGPADITVWYPTSNKNKGPSEYVLNPDTPFESRLPAGATRDAPIKGGKHPLIIVNHGGGGSRIDYFPTNELLAAKGYVVVAPTRFPDPFEAQGPLLSSLINHMLYLHELRNSIDPEKIGALGLSQGGLGVASLAGGDAYGNSPDPRVRGVIIDEGFGVCDANLGTICESVTIPMLLRDGGPLGAVPPFPDLIGEMAREFDLLENAFPRYLVTLDNPAHIGFVTGLCDVIEFFRRESLTYQHEALGVPEPQDPREQSYFFEALPIEFGGSGNGDLSGLFVSGAWNSDALFDSTGIYSWFVPGAGNAGDVCGPEYGGPATPGLGTVLDKQAMIETVHATDLGFWQTVFGNGQSDNSKLEKAVEKLDSVKSFVKVSE